MYALEGYEVWLFISVVFHYNGLFKEMSSHLIANTEITEYGRLIMGDCFTICERIRPALMGR